MLILIITILLVQVATLAVLAVGAIGPLRRLADLAEEAEAQKYPEGPSRWAIEMAPDYEGETPMLTDGHIRELLKSMCMSPAPMVVLSDRRNAPEEVRWQASVVDRHSPAKVAAMHAVGVEVEDHPGLSHLPYWVEVAATPEEAEAKAWAWVARSFPAPRRVEQ